MRRAAEARAGRLDESERSVEPSAAGPGREPVPMEFPSETPRPRLRSVGSQSTAPAADPVTPSGPSPSRVLPSLVERMTATLSRKVVIDRDTDPASKEQYRRLAASLHAAQATAHLKVVMVASAVASEGKSLTAANLALTLSESYQKNVLLIDGDLRRPSQHAVFGLDCSPGLTDGLRSVESRVVLHHVTPHLTLLTAGELTTDPMAVLTSERMARLVQEARETFDWVVIDTPPVGLISDANLLAEAADGALLVVRAESTPYDIVQRAVAMLGRDRVLGVVLNQAREFNAPGYKYDSYYHAAPRDPLTGR
jgi:capsular exopolysaccharide synthesis family protein